MVRRHKPRRGVVLLVVLTLLTLLIVIGLTFVLLAGGYRRAAEANSRQARYGDKPNQLMDRVIYQVVRDTPVNSRSRLTGHSLLRDLYGNDGVAGIVVSWNEQVGGEFLEITFAPVGLANQPFRNSFRTQPGYYNGCTLTILGPVYSAGLDGQPGRAGFDDDGANGADDAGELGWPGSDDISMIAESARVVRYNPSGAGGTITVEWSPGEGGRKAYPRPGGTVRFLVNGRPFNGTGAGYRSVDQTLEATTSLTPGSMQPEMSMLPNYSDYAADALTQPNVGGLDEGWDAVDFQNMFMAMVPADPTVGIIPSYHRPALVNFWLKRFADNVLVPNGVTEVDLQVAAFRAPFGPDGISGPHPISGANDDPVDDSGSAINSTVLIQLANLKRMIILRPLPEDNPNFPNGIEFASTMGLPDQVDPNTGNPAGQQLPEMVWDVDNDGDGIPDSIWIDVGLPIQTDASGRRYRPLVAILCQDLDGRLSVNAHSNTAQRSNWYASAGALQTSPAPPDPMLPATPLPFASFPPMPPQPLLLPRGLGVGPADIFLGHVLGATDLNNVFLQRYSHDLTVSTWAGGESNVDDPMSMIKNLGMPFQYGSQYSAYGMPPDVMGVGGIGLDYVGQPLAFYMGEDAQSIGDPYESVLNRKSAGYTDAPFTIAELERLLRFDDVDAASLPNRLLASVINSAGGNSVAARRVRRLLTTISSHLPVASGMVPASQRNRVASSLPATTAKSYSILDLYRQKMIDGGVPPAQVQNQMLLMVPTEIWHGERFNVNRLLGNGRDDNGNFVVDEPLEADNVATPVWPNSTVSHPGPPAVGSRAVPASFVNVPFNYLNDDFLISTNRFAPQIYARHLYCLMTLLTERIGGANGFIHPTEEAALTLAERQELTAHRIAQWAINVVDFRDPDAIMTPFEYDVDPFNANGWQLMDGDPGTPEGIDRRLVWGAEYPDLLLTETLAFHNRNVKDTAYDRAGQRKREPVGAPTPGDDDFDQYRIPQGTLSLELYCTRNLPTNPRYPNATNTSYPRELYDNNGNLDLGRLAPADSTGFRAPVWRVAISEPLNDGNSPDSLLERAERGTGNGKPDSTSFNPMPTGVPATSFNMDLPSSLRGAVPPSPQADQMALERYVWFTPQAPPTAGDGLATYFCRNFALGADPGNALQRESFVKLAPGSYAVVVPRLLTRIGASDDNDLTTFWDPSPHKIKVDTTVAAWPSIRIFDNDGNDRYSLLLGPPSPIRNPLAIVCAAYAPNTGANVWADSALINAGIGLSVSEPLPQNNYYEEPTFIYDTEVGLADGYDDPDSAQRTPPGLFPDEPFDNIAGRPLAINNLQHTGTTLDYKAVFLQRLANPLEPYDLTRNPYITVDWATVDLTVFNGEENRTKAGYNPGDPFDPYDDVSDDNASNTIRFATRQRGGRASFTGNPPNYGPFIATNPDYRLWSPTSQEPFETQVIPNPVTDVVSGLSLDHYFQYNLVHSLGYLNGTMGAPISAAVASAVPPYTGAPRRPFPWLIWNNRPFANPLELMQVPASTPSRLLHEFEVHVDASGTTQTTNDPYDSVAYGGIARPSNPQDIVNFRGTFRHLLNFFHSSKIVPSNARGANFYRLFDYVETPSPFVGAEKWYNPQATGVDPAGATFRPPYNHLSRFQDPGRININTIFDSLVWEGITKGDPSYDPTALGLVMYNRVLQSRRGYGGLPTELNSNYPTLFAAPFRDADSADLMPNVPDSPSLPNFPSMRRNEPVQATLLREDMFAPGPRREALFVPDESVNTNVLNPYQNQNRHSRFRYHSAARLSNLVSNNSNAYAVWVTLGYFEVEPNVPDSLPAGTPAVVDRAHPDGFRLGSELGTDSGTVKRHRAFYIIDRSVPVAFEPGENHNVDNAILLRRFIE